jgi:hypothetical protein
MKIQVDYSEENKAQTNFTDEAYATRPEDIIEVTQEQYNGLFNRQYMFIPNPDGDAPKWLCVPYVEPARLED